CIQVEEILKAELLGDSAGGLQLTSLRALPVAEVQGIGVEIASRQRRANCGIHSSGERDNGARSRACHTWLLSQTGASSDSSRIRSSQPVVPPNLDEGRPSAR